jgi:hypothetical protein
VNENGFEPEPEPILCRISNLLILKTIRLPTIPRNLHSCHWSCRRQSPLPSQNSRTVTVLWQHSSHASHGWSAMWSECREIGPRAIAGSGAMAVTPVHWQLGSSPLMELVHKDDVDPETSRWWRGLCHDTTLAMQDHCMRYLTPISHAVEHDWGVLEGTGAYIGFDERRLLLSCEHVLCDWGTRQFCHQFLGCEDVFKLQKPLALESHPVDAAICTIEDNVWNMRPHRAEIVPAARVAPRHEPVAGELLFFAGYPEKRSKSLYKNLISRATRLVTQEPPGSPIAGLHPKFFLLAYSPEKAECVRAVS